MKTAAAASATCYFDFAEEIHRYLGKRSQVDLQRIQVCWPASFKKTSAEDLGLYLGATTGTCIPPGSKGDAGDALATGVFLPVIPPLELGRGCTAWLLE